ncbi:ATP-dependent DNA helicase Hrp3 [Kalmusia sp. IMI 367209]|nr:ATP-dependent DNA helicase Hrp3 [Kalmusia sp. IMI 367209]
MDVSIPYTNGHASPVALDAAIPSAFPPPSESELFDTKEPAASSDEDADGEEYNEEEQMEIDAESSEDAEGEADSDFGSDNVPQEEERRRARSSTSQGSSRPEKRKASVEDDFSSHPELYGLRRSGRARLTRRIVDSSDEDELSGSDVPRKRQKTTSRKDSDESDGFVGARRDIPSKKERQRRKLVAEGQLSPSHAEVRFSQRRTKAVTNYNEDGEDSFEEEADDMTPNYWAATVEDTGPAIDKVLDHRPKPDIELDPYSVQKKDFEYLIKWQDKAHYHSTWEEYSTVASSKGWRKLDNYFKGTVMTDMHIHARKKLDPEEFEQHMVARESHRESLLDYHVVERVIDSRDGEEDTEYYVKWKGLNYDNSTWEDASLISSLAQSEIDRYLDRQTNRPVSDSKETNLHTRRKYKPLEEQPDYIKYGKLRSFQLHGLNFLAHNWVRGTNVILADEMGLGKTVQTVSFMNWLKHDRRQQGPFLCVVPLSTMPAWADTFNNWTPDINYVIYTGGGEARRIIQDCELLVDGNPRKVKFNVLLTTYEFVLSDWQFLSQIKWQFLAVDEAHRLKNRESQLYEKLLQFSAPSRLLITGTPIQNTLGELSALMDFLMPGKVTFDENVDLASEDASIKLAELSAAIQPYMIRRTKEKVENDLPPKSEKILRVELSDIQLEYYKNILTRNYEALNEGGQGQKQSLLNIVMELKKASNHALLFPNAEAKFLKENATKEETLKALITTSGKMMLLDRLLAKLKADGHRVLIFSQMVHMLDILTDYMRLRNYQYQRLDGTVPASDRKIAIDHFNAPESEDYCFLLSTRAGGLGINLMTADTVVLFDSDWNPQADLQAMARAHRIGQQKPVSVYRLVSKDTIEEEILERARNKRMLEFITIQRGVTDRQQKELNDKINRAAGEPNSADDINNILKRRGQKMFEQSGNQKKLEELDIDALLENAEEHKTEQAADVKIDLEWDDIIPKDELDVVKAEIQQRKEEEETRKLLEESAPRKRKAHGATPGEREQRAAKRRAREVMPGSDDNTEDEGTNNDPKRPLVTKEIRNLVHAYYRYGSLDERTEEMTREARLVGRDTDMVKTALEQVIIRAKDEIEKQRADIKKDGENKQLTKKDKKKLIPDAIKPASYSCPWGAREDGMLMVGINRHGYGAWVPIRDDPDLGLKEKFFLEENRVDKKEERSKKEEKNAKSPGAVHLVRRANYLLTVLKDKTGADPNAKRLMENHHRNNKKHLNATRRVDKNSSVSASPAPSGQSRKVVSRESEKPAHRVHSMSEGRHSERPESRQHEKATSDHRHRQSDQYRPSESGRKEHRNDRGNNDRRPQHSDRISTPEIRRKISGDVEKTRPKEDRPRHQEDRHPSQSHASSHNGHQRSVDSPSHKIKERKIDPEMEKALKQVRDNLGRLKKATGKNYPNKEKLVKVLKKELIAVGNHINTHTRTNPSRGDDLWNYTVNNYWPRSDVTVENVQRMYKKMVSSESGVKQQSVPENGHTNGA